MVLKYIHKTKSPTCVRLLADRGHPNPNYFPQDSINFLNYRVLKFTYLNWIFNSANVTQILKNANVFKNEIFEFVNNFNFKYLKRIEKTSDRTKNEFLNFDENFKINIIISPNFKIGFQIF
jgi:hypothetical protein